MKKRKACGFDGIVIEFTAVEENSWVKALAVGFEDVLSMGIYPEIWRTAFLRPLLKSGTSDALNPSCYRGIAFVPGLSKLFGCPHC